MKACRTFFGGNAGPARVSCREVMSQADAYVDRELAAAVAASVQRHLVRCAGCLAFVLEKTYFKGRLKASARLIEMPPDLHETVRARIRKYSEEF